MSEPEKEEAMTEQEKVLDFKAIACLIGKGQSLSTGITDAMHDVLMSCNGLTLTEAIARIRCPLSPSEVVERLESLYDEDFRSDWQYGIKRLLADLTAPKEG